MADAFDEGFNHFYDENADIEDNPYDSEFETGKCAEWYNGYKEAQRLELVTRIGEYNLYFDSLSMKETE